MRTATGYTWRDREGNWIDYDQRGFPIRYGDRNDIVVSLAYEENSDRKKRIIGVTDHHGQQVITFNYDPADWSRIIRVTDYSGRQVGYEYNERGDISRVSDLRGNARQYQYEYELGNGSPLISQTIDSEGRVKKFTYDRVRRLLSIEDSLGVWRRYQYEHDKKTKTAYRKEVDSLGGIREFEHGDNGKPSRQLLNGTEIVSIREDQRATIVTALSQYVTRFDEDEFRNIIKITYPDGSSVRYESEPRFTNLTHSWDENGVRTDYFYDSRGNLVREVAAAGTADESATEYVVDSWGQVLEAIIPAEEDAGTVRYRFTYDGYGNTATATDGEGRITAYTYDAAGDILTVTDAAQGVWTYTYDPSGHLLSGRDPLGHTTSFSYDRVGNLVWVTYPNGQRAAYAYDGRNRLVTVTEAEGKPFRYQRDGEGRVTAIIDQEGITLRTVTYDLDGRVRQVVDGTGNAIRYRYADPARGEVEPLLRGPLEVQYPRATAELRYDRRGNLKVEAFVLDGGKRERVEYGYDSARKITSIVDGEGQRYGYQRDSLGRVRRITDPREKETELGVDERGNLLGLVNPRAQETRFRYDRADNLRETLFPLGQRRTYGYDALDRLTAILDGLNRTRRLTYDPADRLTGIQVFADAPNGTPADEITFGYNDRDSYTGSVRGTRATEFVYDDLQRIIAERFSEGTRSLVQGFEYNANDTLKTFRDLTGVEYSMQYDANRQLRSLDIPGVGAIAISYDWLRPSRLVFPGGLTHDRTHDGLMRYQGETVTANGTEIYRVAGITRDGNGRVTDKAETLLGEPHQFHYGYDDSGQLLVVQRDGVEWARYEYDENGNRTRAVANGVEQAGSFDQEDKVLGYGESTFIHNGQGDWESRTGPGGTTAYSYDAFANLTSVLLPGGQRIDYGIDGEQRRVDKRVDGSVVKRWVYDGERNPVAEFDAAGNLVARYVYVDRANVPGLVLREGRAYRIVTDERGSPRLVVDLHNGSIAQRMDYDAFGRVLADTNPGFQPFGFAGGIYDPDTGLVRFGARDYDAATGRWTTRDPLLFEAQDSNLYRYVFNDPINFTDPTGEAALWDVLDIFFCMCSINRASESPTAWNIGMAVLDCIFVVPIIPNANPCHYGLCRWLDDVPTGGMRTKRPRPHGRPHEPPTNPCRGGDCKAPRPGPCSFAAGTLVPTRKGMAPIESLEKGDQVLSRDEATGEVSYRPILKTFRSWHDDGVMLRLSYRDGRNETIRTTAEHPFFVAGKGWVPAGILKEGMDLGTSSARLAKVTAIDAVAFELWAFNFSVQGFQTYFVGETGAWVHNCPRGAKKGKELRGGAKKQRDNFGKYEKRKEFIRWYHKQYKPKYGLPDAEPEDLDEAYQTWEAWGNPTAE